MITAITEPKNYSREALKIYKSLGTVYLGVTPEDVDIIVTRLEKPPALSHFKNLKVVASPTTGLDHIDVKYCQQNGIAVISLQGQQEFLSSVTSTAEHTIGLMLALARNYKAALVDPSQHRESLKGHTLSGKTLGIIGWGRIGKQVAHIARAFGMKIAVNPEDLSSCDFVSVHIPLRGNEGFVTTSMFQQMKPTAYFINTSRSGILQKDSLLSAIEKQEIAGAAMDFADDPDLLKYSGTNLIITNHLGGCTVEDMEKTEIFIANQVKEYIDASI